MELPETIPRFEVMPTKETRKRLSAQGFFVGLVI